MTSEHAWDLPDGARLVDVTDTGAEEWDALAVRSPGGHAFQSHAWGELKAAAGWSIGRFRVDRAGTPVAVFSVQSKRVGDAVARRLGALARLVPSRVAGGSYAYVARGPIVIEAPSAGTGGDGLTDGEGADAQRLHDGLAGVGAALTALAGGVATVDPLWPAAGTAREALRGAGFVPARRDVQISRTATLVPLFADEDDQHRLVRKSTANLINRARREGASVERVDLDPTDGAAGGADREAALVEMHDLLEATARREGLQLRDRDYQIAQWRELGAAGHATLWFAGVDGRRWVGSVTLRCGSTLHQYQAGSADGVDLRNVPANHLLQWEILRWAAADGYRHYDLGGVDTPAARGLPQDERHPLWNLYVFKRGFGAEGVEYVGAHDLATDPLTRVAWRLARGARG